MKGRFNFLCCFLVLWFFSGALGFVGYPPVEPGGYIVRNRLRRCFFYFGFLVLHRVAWSTGRWNRGVI